MNSQARAYDNYKTDTGETDADQQLNYAIDKLICQIEDDLKTQGVWVSDEGEIIDLCDVVSRIAEQHSGAGRNEMNKHLAWLFRQNQSGSTSKILTDECIGYLAEHGAHDEINRRMNDV